MILKLNIIIDLLLVSISTVSCTSQATNKTTNDLQDIIGTTFSLPTSPSWCIMDRDTTITLTNYPKLIVYFNNDTCMPCALKELRHWNPIINQISQLRNDGVFIELIFILQADKQNKDVRNAIIRQNFNFPVMYDAQVEFEGKNILPKNKLIHTFFIDADNKVIFAGNPLISLKHEKILNSLFVSFGKKRL